MCLCGMCMVCMCYTLFLSLLLFIKTYCLILFIMYRNKKVCGIACGGIHNVVYTESGQVYTWGCNDDGSLGRAGEESMPLLVEVQYVTS